MSFFTQWMAGQNGLAAFYEEITGPMERGGVAAIRARLAGRLSGRVIEVGCGTGLNFRHYPATTEVTAIEPLEEFRVFAAARASLMPARITVQDGDAQALPFPDHSFAGALVTLLFCSVPDAARGLAELRRVVQPGGPVFFFEHVRSEHRLGALAQDVCNPVWRHLMDGCNLNRDTVAAIRHAGFTIDHIESHDIRVPRTPHFPLREVHARA